MADHSVWRDAARALAAVGCECISTARFRRELPPGRNQVLQQRAGLPGVVYVKPPLHLPLLSIQPRLLLIEHERSILRGPTLLSAIVPGERLASAGLVEVSVGSQDGRSAPMSFPIR